MLTDELRAQLNERKAEILRYLGDADPTEHFLPPPIIPVPRCAPLALSFAQERLWFLEQLEPRNTAYNICRAARLRGSLNSEALEASVNEIVRRHEVLRTGFEVHDGQPLQVIASDAKLELIRSDLSQFAEADRDPEINRLVAEEAQRPFNLTQAPLLRASLSHLDDANHVFILATHHIVSDAWSMGILTRELWSLYDLYANNRPPLVQDLSIQYADFAVWQRNWLQGDVLDLQLSYWKKQLNDIPMLNLPTDRPRPARQSFRGARQSIDLGRSLTEAINELSHREGVTPFMMLLAAFQVLLYRYSGQEDVIVGSPIANRRSSELDSLIGFFVNTLVLRADLFGNPTFKEALARVRDVCLGAYAHQDLPFEKLVEELKPERDLSRNPLFQVMFVLQNATRPFTDFSGLRVEPIELETTRSRFDLSLFLRERDGKYVGYIEYSTDLFDDCMIERMAGHLQTLLEGIVANPEQPISTLPILTDAERHQILVEWNDTTAHYPRDKCIHELFEEQVEKTPDAIAVLFEGQQLTYRELNIRANKLARHLQELGVRPEVLVGICVDRSLEMVVGLLGILKAGSAYLPLDPSYPKSRLAFMLEDAEVAVVVTQQRYIDSGQWSGVGGQPRYICIDRDWAIIEKEIGEYARSDVDCNNLAYVIYTSGSTGRPKGVAIEHRNTVNLLHWAKSVYGPKDLAGVVAATSICFDLSIFELFVPLSSGGKVILAENAFCLHNLAAKNEISLINTVPSVIAQVLAMVPLPNSVRVVNLAGEPLKAELANRLCEEASVNKVYDLYGPSETTTYSTFTQRHPNGLETIGRPIANTRIYILDGNLQAVPVGVEGEIYIGGDGVARGYLNRGELTAESFVRNPFSNDPGVRLYRTGDRARYRVGGNIEYIGRVDNQVKIRGYRIELGEIEAALHQYPAIKESVVLAHEHDSTGDRELIGYLVPKNRAPVAVDELRTFLKLRLPNYMVPSLFVQLASLPFTPSGKVDRSALPLLDGACSGPEHEFVAPRTEIEELVAQAWREVLNIENLTIYDNFFELGGHSLLATRIVARLRETFDREVPLNALFDCPTIADLSVEIEKLLRTDDAPILPAITPAPRDGSLPLSMNQEHLWRLDQVMPGTHFFNMPYVYRLSGDLNVSALEKALQEIIRRHEALRTVFAEVDGRPIQVISEIIEFHLPSVDLRNFTVDQASEQAASVIMKEREGPFNLSTGPLIRTSLLQLKNEEHFLLVTMHHIIGDHWSMQIFRRELAILYEAFSLGSPSPLRDLRIQFADYALWERRVWESGGFDVQLDYWKKQLATPLPELKFSRTGARKKELRFQTARQPIEISESLFTNIKAIAAQAKCTPCMVVLAALNLVLSDHTGQQDIRIGTLFANRTYKDEGTIGHFLNTLILRFRVTPELTFRQLLQQARRVFLSAYARQELPLERLARVLETEQNVVTASLFQVLLSYQTASSDSLMASGVTFAPWHVPNERRCFDLTPSTFDLIFTLREMSTSLVGTVTYKLDVFEEDIVSWMMGRFSAVLETFVKQTGQMTVDNYRAISAGGPYGGNL